MLAKPSGHVHKLEPNVQVHTRHTACKVAHRGPIGHEHSPHDSTKYGIAGAYDTTSVPDAMPNICPYQDTMPPMLPLDKHENYSHVL